MKQTRPVTLYVCDRCKLLVSYLYHFTSGNQVSEEQEGCGLFLCGDCYRNSGLSKELNKGEITMLVDKERAIKQAIDAYNHFIAGGLKIHDITSFLQGYVAMCGYVVTYEEAEQAVMDNVE